MRTCPNCGELNGDGNTRCYKCNTLLEKLPAYNKICPKCKRIYAGNAETCEKCHVPLAVYTGKAAYNPKTRLEPWIYVVSILAPYVGILLGIIYLLRGEKETAKPLFSISILVLVIGTLISISCASLCALV